MEQYRREQERITCMYRCRELFLLWQCHVLVPCFFLVAHVQVQHRKSFAWSDNYIWESMYRKKFQDQGKNKKQLQVIYRNNHKLEIVWSHSFLWAQNNNCTLELGQLNVTLCLRVSLLMRIFLSQAFTLTLMHTHTQTHIRHACSFTFGM